MSDIGYNDNVQVYGRKFHVQTATQKSKGTASCEVFEEGRLINKNYINFERRNAADEELMEKRIRRIVENTHEETIAELQLMFTIAEKIETMAHAQSHVKMGLLFIRNNLMSDAVDQFNKAIKLNPKEINAYNNLGLSYIKMNDYPVAVKVLENALKIEDSYADIHHNLGLAYYYEKQHYKGLDHIQKALRINPEYSVARYNQAILYLDSILKDKNDKQLPPVTIRVERALQQLNTLVQNNINGMQDVYEKIQKFTTADDIDSAVKFLMANQDRIFEDELHSLIGINFYLRFMYGGRSLTKRSLKKIEQDLIKSIDIKGDYADLWNNLGIIHLIQCRNMFLQALNEFNKALEINPKFEKALKNKKLVENDGKEFLMLLRAILK